MSFHIINIDTENESVARQLPEAAASIADQVHAAVEALADLPADATTAEVVQAYARWSHARIEAVESHLLLLLHECGVSHHAICEVSHLDSRAVETRIGWALDRRDHPGVWDHPAEDGPQYVWEKARRPQHDWNKS